MFPGKNMLIKKEVFMKKKLLYLMLLGTLVCLSVLADLPRSLVNHESNLAYANILTEAGWSRILNGGFFTSDKSGTTSTLERLRIMGSWHPKYPRHPKYHRFPKHHKFPKYPVPEPSTLAFIGSGLIAGAGIYLFSKYKNRKR